VNHADASGNTALHSAAAAGQGKATKFLVEKWSAARYIRNKNGKTANEVAKGNAKRYLAGLGQEAPQPPPSEPPFPVVDHTLANSVHGQHLELRDEPTLQCLG